LPDAPPTSEPASAAEPSPAQEANPAKEPVAHGLLHREDLSYVGSFAVPVDTEDGTEGSLAYAGDGLAFNPSSNSLFMTGHVHHQRTAEISIPRTLGEGSVSELPRARLLQRPVDATGGKLERIADPLAGDFARVGGYLVIDDELVISSYHYYDAGGTQIASHLLADTTLTGASDPFAISDEVPARWLGGAMTEIPVEWRPAFGGDAYLTGQAGIAIASTSSVGPAAASFSLDSSGASATPLVGYSLSNALDVPEQQSELWNLTSEVRGMVFPVGSDSVLFIGRHGTGPYCYGGGEACGDDESPYQGTHAAPYRYQVWAYDAAELAAAHRDELHMGDLEPYDVWELELPIDAPVHYITGVGYDATTGRIFIGQGHADEARPVIHVYEIAP